MTIFAQVPIEAIGDNNLTGVELRVLCCLYSFRNKTTGRTNPSLTTIAKRLNMKDETRISKATTSLSEKGWIKKQKRGFHTSLSYEFLNPHQAAETNLEDGLNSDQPGENDQAQLGENDQTNRQENRQENINNNSNELLPVDLRKLQSDEKQEIKKDIQDVFEFWKVTMDKPRCKLDAKRRNAIARALKSYSATELKSAVIGCSKTPHNMGFNDRNQKFNDIELICRDATKTDRFIESADKPELIITPTAGATNYAANQRTANRNSTGNAKSAINQRREKIAAAKAQIAAREAGSRGGDARLLGYDGEDLR